MTVGQLLCSISSHELTEWMAYERVAGPLGGLRTDVGAAIVASTLANIHRDKRARAYKLADFLPEWQTEDHEDMSPDAVWAAVEQAHRAFTLGR
jgi:hypothetical protein